MSHGKVFSLIKFRTIKQSVYEEASQKGLEYLKWLEGNPENFTDCGRWLQKYYFDELPQLINILKGEMSFVGPRPWAIAQYQRARDRGLNTKDIVPCGLIGVVQSYKGEIPEDSQMDVDYIYAYKDKSAIGLMWFDLKIFLRCVAVVIAGKGI